MNTFFLFTLLAFTTTCVVANDSLLLNFNPGASGFSVEDNKFQGVALTQTTSQGVAFRAIVHVKSIINQDEAATLLSLKSATNKASVSLQLLGDQLALVIMDGMTKHTYEIATGKQTFPMDQDVDLVLSLLPIGAGGCWIKVFINGAELPMTSTQITPADLKYDQLSYQQNFIGTTQLLQVYNKAIGADDMESIDKIPTGNKGFEPIVPNTASTSSSVVAIVCAFVAAMFL